MDELTQLANALMALDDKLAACMKCGFPWLETTI